MGSGLIEKYQYLRENAWFGIWSQRILSQLYYLIEVSRFNGNTYKKLLCSAVEKLYAYVQENGAIHKEVTLELEEMLAPMQALARSYEVLLVGHAHIDMNWKWGFQETVSITVDTFETVLQLMEEYPQFKFSQSQASVYRILEQYKPELLDRIRQKIREGRWEVTASTWVENDKNLSGSEAQVRQILYTKQYLSALLEIPMEALDMDFEPDTFGHPENMPELFSQGGIRYYYHCRGNDQEYAYRWRAPSGAEVLTFREPIWYNDKLCEYDCLGYVPSFCDRYGMHTAMKVYGVGDHGGGPTRRELNHFIQMQSWPLMPKIRFAFMREFFARLEEVRDVLPVVQRELNFVYTGCYTTQARIKRGNKLCEDRIYEAEVLDAAAKLTLEQYRTPAQFAQAWEKLLFNQFHDVLPGAGVHDTVEYAMGQYQEVLATAQVNMKNAMIRMCREMDTSCFGEPGETDESLGAGVGYGTDDLGGFVVSQVDRSSHYRRVFTVFNPTPYPRREPVQLAIWDWSGNPRKLYAIDTSGREFACQFLEEGPYYAHHYQMVLLDVDVPAMGYASYVLEERIQEDFGNDWSAFRSGANVQFPPIVDHITDMPLVLENELVKAQFSPNTMKLLSFVDKRSGREMIDRPSCGFRLITENTKQRMVAWCIGRYMKTEDLSEERAVRLLSAVSGSLRKALRYDMEFENSRLEVTVSLDAHSTVLEFNVRIFWHELGSEEKGIPQLNFSVPFGYAADAYLCNIPMGTLRRPPLAQDVPCIGFMAGVPQNGNVGIGVMSDCKYGFRGCDNAIALSMVRSSFRPDTTPDQGEHTVRIGVGIVDMDSMPDTYEKFTHPLAVCTNQIHTGALPASDSWLQMTGAARIQSMKWAENGNGVLIRLHNPEKKAVTVSLRLAKPVCSACLTDITERQDSLICHGDTVTLKLGPSAMRTVRMTFSQEERV